MQQSAKALWPHGSASGLALDAMTRDEAEALLTQVRTQNPGREFGLHRRGPDEYLVVEHVDGIVLGSDPATDSASAGDSDEPR